MAVGSVRFVQAGHFRLEQPCGGLAEVPEHLTDLLIEAPYAAAEQVCETAVAQEADFLLLCGDLIDPARAGPRGVLFLIEQFRWLAERNIPVYWAGGRVDPPDAWPLGLALPENVHVFPDHQAQEFVVEREGEPLLRITGMSSPGGAPTAWEAFEPDPAGLPTVAVGYAAEGQHAPSERAHITYWALGGRAGLLTVQGAAGPIHWSGSPQGRSACQIGPHGCTVVSVDRSGEVLLEPVATDVLRWFDQHVELDAFAQLERQRWREVVQTDLCRRIEALKAAHPKLDLMVHWHLSGAGALARWLAGSGVAAELLDELRVRYGCGSPAAWSAALAVEHGGDWPQEWLRAEGVRADYLKLADRWRSRPEEPLGLEEYLPAECAERLESLVCAADAAERAQIVGQAALLGSRLLSGEEETP